MVSNNSQSYPPLGGLCVTYPIVTCNFDWVLDVVAPSRSFIKEVCAGPTVFLEKRRLCSGRAIDKPLAVQVLHFFIADLCRPAGSLSFVHTCPRKV